MPAPADHAEREARAITPRGFNRRESAAYVGISPSKFDELVADGRMPRPRCIDKRRVWDRYELDDAFEALPHMQERSAWDV